MEEFANHTVVIVGGAKGIGLATVRLFLEAGAHVLAGDIDTDALEAAVTHLKARSPQAALVGMKCTSAVSTWPPSMPRLFALSRFFSPMACGRSWRAELAGRS